jgi:beta-galactosidase
MYRGIFNLPKIENDDAVSFFYNSIGTAQSIYINGKLIAANIQQNEKGNAFVLDAAILHAGTNTIAITTTPLLKKQPWDNINTDPGLFQIISPAENYKRKLFSGLAQVIVQATGEAGEIVITATANGLKQGEIKIQSVIAELRPAVK